MKKSFFALMLVSSSVFAADLTTTALTLLNSIEESEYCNRAVCIKGNDVVGIVPCRHWSLPNSIAKGTLKAFPVTVTEMTERKSPIAYTGKAKLVKTVGGTEFFERAGTIDSVKADVCVYESKVLLE
jgi:hypothetical protein